MSTLGSTGIGETRKVLEETKDPSTGAKTHFYQDRGDVQNAFTLKSNPEASRRAYSKALQQLLSSRAGEAYANTG